ncbi:NADPH-adrenodoxin reductase [Sporobolomyces salmoneus]|uniref:NADPH-adrenodoxin reductase n=1 Tax=Sporobolomyces salmoneus TaxID=183962 RepID=UPI0031745A3C
MLSRIPRPRLASSSRLQPLLSFSTSTRSASSSSTLNLGGKPYRIAIVGGGPAGFYAAGRLLGLPGSEQLKVDLFELLPTPFGLARFGVAPDHPEVKNCEHKFEETAKDPRFRYFGNVQVCGTSPSLSSPTSFSSPSSSSSSSTIVPNLSPSSLAIQLPLSSLLSHYSSTLLTYGASLDRPLSIPGEFELSNVLSARSFVNWYNGHPYHSSLLSPLIDLSKIEHVSIVGQGNVALDVARILLKPVEELKEFDVPDYVLEELSRSRVKRVEVVGRRGVMQLAATTKELREMMNLDGVGFDGIEESMLEDAQGWIGKLGTEGRAKKRALGLLEKGSKTPRKEAEKSWSLEFLKSPKQLLPLDSTTTSPSPATVSFESLTQPPQKVGQILYDLNELVPSSSNPDDPSQCVARPTGQTQTVKTDMVFKSVGYRSIGLPGLPFDERKGIVRNENGRVVDENGEPMTGLYTSGWLARGPNGVIATTMFNAFSTADLIASDLSSSPSSAEISEADIETMIEQVRGGRKVVNWEEWEKVDRVEKERGRGKGKLREKITSVEEMLQVL